MTEKRKRPPVLSGTTYQITTGCGDLFVTINEDSQGPFEVFLSIGKAGGCSSCQSEAIGRLTSLSLRLGGNIDQVIKQLVGISCHQSTGAIGGAKAIGSCADAVAQALLEHKENGNGS